MHVGSVRNDLVPGDLVKGWHYEGDGALSAVDLGMVICAREANFDNRFSYPCIYYVWYTDRGVVGPLFREELSKL